jgi:hypothetical protein
LTAKIVSIYSHEEVEALITVVPGWVSPEVSDFFDIDKDVDFKTSFCQKSGEAENRHDVDF